MRQKLELRVVESLHTRGLAFIACDVYGGEIQLGDRFKGSNNQVDWTVLSLSKVSPELYKLGRRGISLSPSLPNSELSVGDVLFG